MNPVDKLSFDILGEVFSHYVEEEDIFFPLETLLLVSQSWSQAALGHRALWAQLRIYLGHEPTGKIWRARLPLRLKRAGTSVPLQIILYNVFHDDLERVGLNHEVYTEPSCTLKPKNGQYCPCWRTTHECSRSLLRTLAGPNGEYCKRWKSLDLVVGPSNEQTYTGAQIYPLDEIFYPTPLLSVLSMENSHQSKDQHRTAFPFTPQLRRFNFNQCRIKELPDLSIAREIILDLDYIQTGGLPNLTNLKHAKIVEVLDLRMCRRYGNDWRFELSAELPHLRSLSLTGGKVPSNLADVQAPNLKHLEVRFDEPELLDYIVKKCELPLSQIHTLAYWWAASDAGAIEPFLDITTDLLLRADSLTHIEGDKQTLSIILKLFWDADAEGEKWTESYVGRIVEFFCKDLVFGIDSGPHQVVLAGPMCGVNIEALASSLELFSPSLEWSDFQTELQGSCGCYSIL